MTRAWSSPRRASVGRAPTAPASSAGPASIGRSGWVAAAANVIWGLLTLYWKQLVDFDPFELIGWRIIASTLVMVAVVSARRSWGPIRAALRTPPVAAWIVVAAALLTVNWGSYVYAVVNDRVVETALGYFISPLLTMALGVVVLRERPTRAQKLAMVLAAAAVLQLTVAYGRVPVAALVIASSWSLYALCKRHIPLGAVDGFAAETFVVVVPAIAVVSAAAGGASSVPQAASVGEMILVSLTGVTTSVPLIMFAYAAVRVPFTILGTFSYAVPTITLLLGRFVYHEPLPVARLVGFAIVWLALAILTVERVRSASGLQGHTGRGAAVTAPTR